VAAANSAAVPVGAYNEEGRNAIVVRGGAAGLGNGQEAKYKWDAGGGDVWGWCSFFILLGARI
jgi:hypothetical protein